MRDTRETYSLPVLPLKNAVVFPYVAMPISVGRPKSIAALDSALASKNKTLLVLAQKNSKIESPSPADLYSIGTTAQIKLIGRTESIVQIILQGIERVKAIEFKETPTHLEAHVESIPIQYIESVEQEALQREVMDLTSRYFSLAHPEVELNFPPNIAAGEDILQLIYPLSQLLPLDINSAQALLETRYLTETMELMRDSLLHEIQILDLRHQIADQAQEKMSQEQRDYILRQQMHAIKQELGDKSFNESDIDELRNQIASVGLPEEVMKEAERELKKLEQIPITAPDYQVSRAHLELIIELPWHETTTDNLNLDNARQILNDDHYGLEEIKERIIEQLAVMKLNPDAKAPILCFVGPPGVGKTSLGQSISHALGRKFERFSLGGMHDEAELRGHRRTYIGAMPGRIIQAIRRTGVNNPLLMLDEVDKLGHDFRGDPAAALMEILDPAQNFAFRDNYLDLPFDLSKVFFITTANATDKIPKPLFDRMETLRLSGYSGEEKIEIAKRYLLPRQRQEAGLNENQFMVPDDTLLAVINRYTREAGVRELERMLARLARKVAVHFADDDYTPITVKEQDLIEMLGSERFFVEEKRLNMPTGVATGLAWTDTGGDVLYIEVISLPHGDKLTLTGHLGDVMKESAMAANNYVIAHGKELGVREPIPEAIHIHVPAGAIPKDGPSAGTTIATAITSLYTNRQVRSDTAMTGEITLSGLVLPVGGIKEKILAARRAGIKRVILPEENKKDLRDLPDHVKDEMEFVMANRIEDVLKAAIVAQPVLHEKTQV